MIGGFHRGEKIGVTPVIKNYFYTRYAIYESVEIAGTRDAVPRRTAHRAVARTSSAGAYASDIPSDRGGSSRVQARDGFTRAGCAFSRASFPVGG